MLIAHAQLCHDANCHQPPECQHRDDDVVESFEKLELIDGQILHRTFFNSRLGKMRSDECYVFSDGTQSEGCAREEFQTYVSVRSLGNGAK